MQLDETVCRQETLKSVWQIPAPGRSEKRLGNYPTRKPLKLIVRILLASSDPGDMRIDPVIVSGTTLTPTRPPKNTGTIENFPHSRNSRFDFHPGKSAGETA